MNKGEIKFLFSMCMLLFASVSMAFSTRFENAFDSPKLFFLQLFSTAILIAMTFYLAKYRATIPQWRLLLPIAIYFAVVMLSWFMSKNRLPGADSVVALFMVLTAFAAIAIFFRKEDADKAVPYFLILGASVAAYSLMQHVGIDPVQWAQDELVKNRSISTLGNPDFLSSFLVMIIPLAFARAMTQDKPAKFIPLLILWGFLCMVNVFTYSRTGLISMFIGIALCAFLLGGKVLFTPRWKIAAAIIMLILAFGGISIMEKAGKTEHSLIQRVEAFGNLGENNVATRLGLWKAGALIFLKNPLLGVGPGNFDGAYLQFRYLEPVIVRNRVALPGSPHNLFLEIADSSGVFALLAFLAFTGIFCYLGIRYFKGKAKENSSEGAVVAGYAAAIGAFYVHHMAVFSTIPTDMLFWAFAGFCWLYIRGDEKPAFKEQKIGSTGWIAIAIVVITGLGGIGERAKLTLADFYARKAQMYRKGLAMMGDFEQKSRVFEESFRYFNLALKLNPKSHDYWLSRGKLLEEFSYESKDQDLTKTVIAQAEKSYMASIRLIPTDPYPYADMGRMLSRWGGIAPSEEFYRKAVALDPYNPILATDLAIVLQSGGKDREAEECFRKAIELYPIGYNGYGNLGIYYFTKKEYGKAGENLKKALEYASQSDSPDKEAAVKKFEGYLERIKESDKGR